MIFLLNDLLELFKLVLRKVLLNIFGIEELVALNLAARNSMVSTDYTKCRRQQVGRKRMLCSEEHRKAVCGKTARTV